MASGLLVFVYSEEFEKLTSFYQEILEVDGKALGPNWMEFPLTPAKFAVHRQDENDSMDKLPYRFDLLVSDIDSALKKAKTLGAIIKRGIQDEAFGKSAILHDPEGREFMIIEEER